MDWWQFFDSEDSARSTSSNLLKRGDNSNCKQKVTCPQSWTVPGVKAGQTHAETENAALVFVARKYEREGWNWIGNWKEPGLINWKGGKFAGRRRGNRVFSPHFSFMLLFFHYQLFQSLYSHIRTIGKRGLERFSMFLSTPENIWTEDTGSLIFHYTFENALFI